MAGQQTGTAPKMRNGRRGRTLRPRPGRLVARLAVATDLHAAGAASVGERAGAKRSDPAEEEGSRPVASGDEEIRTGGHGVPRGFGRGLVMVLALATAVRVAFIFGFHHDFALTSDAWVYHHEARFVANGRGFVSPVSWFFEQKVKPAADHPPLYIVLLAITYVLGVRSHLAQLALNGVIGVVTVALIALLARRLVGDRGGIIAGVIAALYPGLWAWNGQALSESLAALMLTAVLGVAYRYLEDRSVRRAALLGGLIGLAALTRSELALLVLLIPCLLFTHYRAGRGLGQLVKHGAVAMASVLIVVAPWTTFNLSRFERPVMLGTGFGRALASGSCPHTINGTHTGYWSMDCLNEPMGVTRDQTIDLDESQMEELWRQQTVRVMVDNRRHIPMLMVARVGRMFQFWAPLQQLGHDQLGETREWWVAGAAFATFYLLAAGAVVGAIVLRRRRVRLWILVLPIAIAAVGAMTAFGTSRYRAPAEPCLVVLAAVGVDAAVRRFERRRAETAAAREATNRRFDGVTSMTAGALPRENADDWAMDLRQRALWTGRSGSPGDAAGDEPYWDEQHGAWTDGQGNYTDGYRTWSIGGAGGPGSGTGGSAPLTREWDDGPEGVPPAGAGGSEARSPRGPKAVRLSVVVAAVISTMVGVSVLGAWFTDVTGTRMPFTPVDLAPPPALPPRR
jgi:4-amino-4-deoxy-L-arabinose transferase-like glycosyltransferase